MNNFKNSLNKETTNKAAFKPMYKCGVCDSIYDSIIERAQCEIECTKKAENAARKAAEEKKKLERTTRKKEVDLAIENAQKLMDRYVKDYGNYSYKAEESITLDDLLGDFFKFLP